MSSDFYRLRLLGPVSLEQNGEPVQGFVSRKAVALLGYLAIQTQPLTRSHLADMFWPDKSETRARGNLSRAMSNLSKLIPDCLEADYHTVVLRPQPIEWIDTVAFDELAAQDKISTLTAATQLYRDELMADLVLKDCNEFETWLNTERERWRRRIIKVFQALSHLHTHNGNIQQSMRFVSRWLQLAPWDEAAHRAMMLGLAQTGQRSAALVQYERCRRSLVDELGVEPTAETTDLYHRLQAGEGKRRLPTPVTSFVGQEQSVAEIIALLDNPHCRLLTLLGPGGAGKTRLAIQAAARLTGFPDGVTFIALAPVSSVDFLVPVIADALEFSPYGNDPQTQLLNYLRRQELLLILDNFEHVLDGVDLLARILAEASRIKLLVTSQERLNLREEWLFRVQGLSLPESGDDLHKDINASDAGQLFLQRARQVDPGFALTAADRSAIARICRLVEGLPLAIELAAAWVGMLTCQEIADEIEHNLGFLTTSLRNVPDRHHSLRAVFDYSWQQLSDVERILCQHLSVFRGGFDRTAAEEATGASLRMLSALVDKSLIHRTSTDRYAMHELLRQYAAEKLDAAGAARKKTHDLHCAYFAEFLGQREAQHGGNQKQKLAEISLEIDNVRAAWRWAIEQRRTEELETAWNGLFGFYEIRGRFQEGWEMFGQAATQFKPLPGDPPGPPEALLRGRLLSRQAWFGWRLGRYQASKMVQQTGLRALHQVEPASYRDIAFASVQLGLVNWYLGHYEEAKRLLQEGLIAAQGYNDSFTAMLALIHLGLVACAQGDYAAAKIAHQEGLTICQAINERRGVGTQLIYLGFVACLENDETTAARHLQTGLSICREIRDRFGTALGLKHLGALACLQKQYDQARQLYQDSVTRFAEIGDRWGIATTLNQLGRVSLVQDDRPAAKAYYQEALQKTLAIEAMPWALIAVVGLATLLLIEANFDQAVELLSLVHVHPAVRFETKAEVRRLLAEFKLDLNSPTATTLKNAAVKFTELLPDNG